MSGEAERLVERGRSRLAGLHAGLLPPEGVVAYALAEAALAQALAVLELVRSVGELCEALAHPPMLFDPSRPVGEQFVPLWGRKP